MPVTEDDKDEDDEGDGDDDNEDDDEDPELKAAMANSLKEQWANQQRKQKFYLLHNGFHSKVHIY